MLTDYKLPLGQYIASFVEWLTDHGADLGHRSTLDLAPYLEGI